MSYEPFEDLLICPECHSRLKKENVGFICINSDSCGCSYPVYFNVSSNVSVTCTAPSNGTPQYSLVSVPGTVKVYTVPYQFSPSNPLYIAFIGESASECYFTPGEGF